ncbi:MAG: type II secretion system F family protein, partial [Candidatus Thorarchaeota archaeon]|nr:type II secretion system F family protein [Candidatus Thorarchaeota archaeon]
MNGKQCGIKIITPRRANTKGMMNSSNMVAMDVSERYVRLCGEVSNFTKAKTGVSFVDAYIGPENLDPEKQSTEMTPEELVQGTEELMDQVKGDVDSPLRAEHLLGECKSMIVTIDWLSGKNISYGDLVQGLFNIPLKRFSESVIDKKIEELDEALQEYPGSELRDRVTSFTEQGEISGADLKQLVENELQTKAKEVGQLFQEKVYSLVGTTVTDNGVEYQTVTDAPWSGYNWYQKGFKSLNQFNVDVTFNKVSLQGVIYHEYEHHVSNLWREKYFMETGNLELAVVPLHTGRCVISEGTADT